MSDHESYRHVMCHVVPLQMIVCSPFRHSVALRTVATTIDLAAPYLQNEEKPLNRTLKLAINYFN